MTNQPWALLTEPLPDIGLGLTAGSVRCAPASRRGPCLVLGLVWTTGLEFESGA